MSNEPKQSVYDSVLASIDTGKLKQHSHWYFTLRAAVLFLASFLILLIVLFLISFTVFSLRQNGAWEAPNFGTSGLKQLVLALPWMIILAALILLGLLEILVRRYEFAYKRPLLYSVLGLAVLVSIGSVIFVNLHVHEQFFRRAEQGGLSLAGPLYRQFGSGGCRGLTAGNVLEKTPSGFLMQSGPDQIQVIVSSSTRVSQGADLDLNDQVVVLGQCRNNIMQAQAVREMDYHIEPFPGNPPPPPQ